MIAAQISWVGLDWGTSNLRAYAMDGNNQLIAQLSSSEGMSSLTREQFEPTLIQLIAPWLKQGRTLPVIACGMVGAKQGWCEAAYRQVPCLPVSADGNRQVATKDNRISVEIVPGLCQTAPPDVMRGEEVHLAGLLALEPDFSGNVCLPGTHSKWVRLKDGKVQAFQTYMTGELFSLLADVSILKHSIHSDHFDEESFLNAAMEVFEDPAAVMGNLFKIRARSLLQKNDDSTASRLSGLLVGQELAAAKTYWQGSTVKIIGAGPLAERYQKSLRKLNGNASILPSDDAIIAGLKHVKELKP